MQSIEPGWKIQKGIFTPGKSIFSAGQDLNGKTLAVFSSRLRTFTREIRAMQKPFIIGITGGSGSGKTTFVKRLRATFPENELCILSQDDYYKPKELQKVDKQGIINFDLPGSIDKKALYGDLKALMRGESVQRLEYTFNNTDAESKTLTFTPAPVIVLEGIFVMHFRKLRKAMDLSIFLYAKENLKVIRRIKRDQAERNYPIEDVLYRYEHHVLPTFEKYVKPYLGKADIVINNNKNLDRALDVVSSFLKHQIALATSEKGEVEGSGKSN